MLKKTVSEAAGESKPEAYPQGYVEDFDELRTKLADFSSILRRRLLRGKDRGITGQVLDLLHRDDDHFLCRVDLQHFHIITDRMADRILDQQLLIVYKYDFYPVLHAHPLIGPAVFSLGNSRGIILIALSALQLAQANLPA